MAVHFSGWVQIFTVHFLGDTLYHGDSKDDNFSKTVDDSVNIIQRLLYLRDYELSVEDIYAADSALETVWKMQEKADSIDPILSNVDTLDLNSSFSPDVISMFYSGLCGAMNNYAKYREMSNLFEGEQYLIKNTILSSDTMANNTTDETRDKFINHILNLNQMGNVIEIHNNLRNEENSYFNLYHSAVKVQETMNVSSPAAWAAIWGAIEEAAYSVGDDLIMGVIDYTFFGGLPVSSLVNSGVLFCVDGLKNTAYGKEQNQIAELDDYVFIQEVAKDCFKEYSLTSENAYNSFILGLKSTMLAYKTNGEDTGWEPNNKDNDSIKAYNDINMMLNVAFSNSINTDFYNAFPSDCDDLTKMLGSNTDISKLDTTPRKDITIDNSFQNKVNDNWLQESFISSNDDIFTAEEYETDTQVMTEWQFGSVVKDEDTILFAQRDYNSMGFSIVAQDVLSGNLNTLITTEMSSYENYSNIALIGNQLYYSDKNGINAYDIETMSNELKLSESYISIVGVNDVEQYLILQSDYDDTKYYTYNISNKECKNILQESNAGLLTTDELNLYYYTNDDKNFEFDKIYHTHIYKYELTTGITTELAAIPISVHIGYPTYGISYVVNNKLVFSYGFYDGSIGGGGEGWFYYTIAYYDLQTHELKTIATDIEVNIKTSNGIAFEFADPYVYYYDGYNNNTIQYNIETSEYKTLNISWVDNAIESGLLYTVDANNKYNYCKYDFSSNQTMTLINQSDIITSIDPSDAYCSYNCIGVINGQAVIEVTIYSYQEEYNPFGCNPGYVRSILKIIKID